MSWKSLLTAGLLCIVASPAFAVPTLKVTSGGLDGSGQWVWNVTIAATTGTSPVAAELGFRETTAGAQLVSATAGAAFTGVNTQNPGTQIFTWETTDPTANGKPVGLQTNLTLDEIFASMGSFADVPAADTQYLTITTAGPVDTRLSTAVQVLGKYAAGGGAGANGRIAEITSGTNATNYNNFAGSASRTVVVGDTNLSGVSGGGAAVTIADFSTLVGNLNKPGSFHWGQGDLNGTTGGTEVTIADFSLLVGCLNKTTGACNTSANTPLNVAGAPGAGSGGGASLEGVSAVPEPASVALAGLGLLGAFGMMRRRR